MSQQPVPDGGGLNLLFWLTTGGGIALVLREARQFWRDRRAKSEAKTKAAAAAPEVVVAVESRAVATAKDVLDMVDDLVQQRLAPLTAEVAVLRGRIGVLEDELRAHNIPIPSTPPNR